MSIYKKTHESTLVARKSWSIIGHLLSEVGGVYLWEGGVNLPMGWVVIGLFPFTP